MCLAILVCYTEWGLTGVADLLSLPVTVTLMIWVLTKQKGTLLFRLFSTPCCC